MRCTDHYFQAVRKAEYERTPSIMLCSCGNRADVQVPKGPALCMRCWTAFQNSMQENQRLNFAFLNFLQDQMASVAGLPSMGPRLRVPMARAPITMNTTNNIRVE